jgi:hypothetical protein
MCLLWHTDLRRGNVNLQCPTFTFPRRLQCVQVLISLPGYVVVAWKLLQKECRFGNEGLSSHSEETKKCRTLQYDPQRSENQHVALASTSHHSIGHFPQFHVQHSQLPLSSSVSGNTVQWLHRVRLSYCVVASLCRAVVILCSVR